VKNIWPRMNTDEHGWKTFVHLRLIILWLFLASCAFGEHIDLSGEWKRGDGDNSDFARPGFDDSAWSNYELPRKGPMPQGVFWLRRTVPIQSGLKDTVVVIGAVSPCYDVFVNGLRIASNACSNGTAEFFGARAFPLSGGEGSSITVALRVEGRLLPGVVMPNLRDEGPYLLTASERAKDTMENARLKLMLAASPTFLSAVMQISIGLLLLMVWGTIRERIELLWLALYLMCLCAYNLSQVTPAFTGFRAQEAFDFLLPTAYVILTCCAHVVLRDKPMPLYLLVVISALTLLVRSLTSGLLYFAPSFALAVWMSIAALRNGTTEQRYFAGGILFYAVSLTNATARIHIPNWPIPTTVYLGNFMVVIPQSVTVLVALALMLALVRIAGISRREKERLANEMAAAGAVQRLLVAGVNEQQSAYTTDAIYLPAQEMSGDFFHVLHAGGGRTLVVAGDVSGKGLRAALVVSLLIGVVRDRRLESPAALLGHMNRAIAGAVEGFTTCCALLCEPDGRAWIASAGHPAPFLDGEEVVIQPGLPLGIDADAEYEDAALEIKPGVQLTLFSDGVIEADNGELFGFERTRAISGKSAQEIAAAAKEWGQNDDITVVTVRRVT